MNDEFGKDGLTRRQFLKVAAVAAGALVVSQIPVQRKQDSMPTSKEKPKSKRYFATIFDLYPKIPGSQPEMTKLDRDNQVFTIFALAEGNINGTPLANKLQSEGILDTNKLIAYHRLRLTSPVPFPALDHGLVMGVNTYKDYNGGASVPTEYLEVAIQSEATFPNRAPNRGNPDLEKENLFDPLEPKTVNLEIITNDGRTITQTIEGQEADDWIANSHTNFFVRLGEGPEFSNTPAANVVKPDKPLKLENIQEVKLSLRSGKKPYSIGSPLINFTAIKTPFSSK